jgi:glyoxylase-like metal-dependent hydrolase (beta-lactamase superfamily II)
MTLDGTNTWVVGSGEAVMVIDPGPQDEGHLRAVAETGQVTHILLTHGHPDHAEGARRLHELTRAPVRALDPAHRLGGEGLVAGEVTTVGDVEVHVVATPGHTSDCLSFFVPSEGALLTGDTVLGRGTTVVAYPDGNLGAYLESLTMLRDLAQHQQATHLLPGHGPVLDDPIGVLDAYLEHRRVRLDQIRAVWAGGRRTAEEIVDIVYADVPATVRFAALASTLAQVAYLEGR